MKKTIRSNEKRERVRHSSLVCTACQDQFPWLAWQNVIGQWNSMADLLLFPVLAGDSAMTAQLPSDAPPAALSLTIEKL
jgi:hypothetical protein